MAHTEQTIATIFEDHARSEDTSPDRPVLTSVVPFVAGAREPDPSFSSERVMALAASALEYADQPVVVLDDDFSVRSVNQAFTRTTGLDYGEVAVLMPDFLQDDTGLPLLPGRPARELKESLHWHGEAWCRRSDGTRFPLTVSITSVASSTSGDANHMVVFTRVPDDEDEQRQLDYLATHDDLTRLPNRRLFIENAEDLFAQAYRDDGQVGVLLIDLDRFGAVNQSLGSAQGDFVIKGFAERLRDSLSDDFVVARLGGDEFAILRPGANTPDELTALGNEILDTACRPFTIGKEQIYLTCSVGAACFPQDGADLDEIMGHAGEAVRQAKDMGRNLVRLHRQTDRAAPADDFILANALRQALEDDQLTLDMQPLVSLQDGTVIGCEALVRWRHPRLGLISPDRFIPLAEETGLIGLVGDWVLRTACDYAALWRRKGVGDVYVSVNLSARQLATPGLVTHVASLLGERDVPPERLVLEVTESAMMKDVEQTRRALDGLSDLGCRIAIDDFGTGYSSLSYLRDFPVDILKIDQSFVAGIPDDPQSMTIARTVIAMGRALGMTVIAEGVETANQLDLLRDQGCDIGQGFFISRPRPAATVDSFIRRGFRLGAAKLDL